MEKNDLRCFLEQIRDGRLSVEEGINLFKNNFYLDVGCAKIDTHREERVGYPEVIYCPGKTEEQIRDIFKALLDKKANILATRATENIFKAIQEVCPEAVYSPVARIISFKREALRVSETYISIVTAGTSDLPVAEEAAVTAEHFGNRVERTVDVGVAGIHRLFHNLEVIKGARVVIVVAGMDGALPSIIGGLVDKPVIAVPTSTGYGASFGGLSALLTMLNSCASGVCVVNIDNGFGAGYMASIINKLK